MNCIDDEIIQQLLDGELSEAQKQKVMGHIKTCKACKARLEEDMALHRSLDVSISRTPCPSDKTLEAFATNALGQLEKDQVDQHVVLCPRCDDYVKLCLMTKEELIVAEEREKSFFLLVLAEDKAEPIAKETINKLLPKDAANIILGGLWDRVVKAFEKMCDKGLEKLPRISSGGEFAGALGFSGGVDPQIRASAIIAFTTLATIHQADILNVSGNRDKIKELAGSFADQLGAGKELKARILQILPEMVASGSD